MGFHPHGNLQGGHHFYFTSEKAEAGTGEGLPQASRWRWPLRFEATGRPGSLTLAEQWVWGGWGSHDQDGFQSHTGEALKNLTLLLPVSLLSLQEKVCGTHGLEGS